MWRNAARSGGAGDVRVQYQETYSRVAALQAELQVGLQEMEAEYNQIQSMLTEVDGATTAALMSAMEQNRQKALITGRTLRRLLSFLNNSTNFVEQEEQRIGNVFNQNHGAGGLG